MYQIIDDLRVYWWIFDFLHGIKSGKTVVYVVNSYLELHFYWFSRKKFPLTFLFNTTFLLIFKKISLLHSYLVLLFFINFHVKFAPTLLFKPTSIFGTLEYMHSRISHERIEPWTTSIIPGLHEPIVLIIKVQIFWEGRKNLVHLPIFIWHYLVASNHKWKMVQVFVVFSEYPNFTLEQFEKAK